MKNKIVFKMHCNIEMSNKYWIKIEPISTIIWIIVTGIRDSFVLYFKSWKYFITFILIPLLFLVVVYRCYYLESNSKFTNLYSLKWIFTKNIWSKRENFFTLNYWSKNFLLEKGQLSESIYDLIINKCHFIGLLP